MDPDKRPTFHDITTILTNLTSHSKDQKQGNGSHPLDSEAVSGTSEDPLPNPDSSTSQEIPLDSNITSPVYSNFPPREQMIGSNFFLNSTPSLPIPEEYEVPNFSRESSLEEGTVPQQPVYEVPLTTRTNSNESAIEEEREHIYHTLEPQEA